MFPFNPSPGGAPQIHQGRCFQYVIPSGWTVAEDGPSAVVLFAPDRCALTILVGNAGMPLGYPPPQFIYEKLMAMRPDGLQLGPGRPTAPMPGFAQAIEFDYFYGVGGVACRGVAACHVAMAYDSCSMVLTAAASQASQWPTYASWLPQIPRQVTATSGEAFGARGVMQQNLAISTHEGELQRQYREWSAQQWNAVVDERHAVTDRQQHEFRENLGAVGTWVNPYGYPPVELSTQFTHYWINRQGKVFGTNDPGVDPNVGSTEGWMRMQRNGR